MQLNVNNIYGERAQQIQCRPNMHEAMGGIPVPHILGIYGKTPVTQYSRDTRRRCRRLRTFLTIF